MGGQSNVANGTNPVALTDITASASTRKVSPEGAGLSKNNHKLLPHQTETGEDLMVLSQQDSSVYWYLAKCHSLRPKPLRLASFLSKHIGADNVYCPLQFSDKSSSQQEKLQPVLPHYVFIRGSIEKLLPLFSLPEINCDWHLLKRYKTTLANDYQIVSDDEVSRFRWFCDNQSEDLLVLDKPFIEFHDKMKVRVIDGPMAGLEGIIHKVKGDRHFVFRVGTFAVLVKHLLKWHLEIIGDNSIMKQAFSIYDYIDRIQEQLQSIKDSQGNYPYYYDSARALSLLILYSINENANTSSRKQYLWIGQSINLFPELEEIQFILSALPYQHRQALEPIRKYIQQSHSSLLTTNKRPDLSPLFRQGSLRPFLTSSCQSFTDSKSYCLIKHPDYLEFVQKVNISEDYYAHIALIQHSEGVTAISNWTTASQALKVQAQSSSNRIHLLTKIFGAEGYQGVTFQTISGITGPSYTFRGASLETTLPNIQTDLAPLLKVSIELLTSIWSSTYHDLRRQLLPVWTKVH